MSARATPEVQTAGLPALLDLYIDHHRRFWREEPELGTDGQPKARPAWRCSSLGYCLRAQVLERAGVPPTREIDERTRRTFQWGDDLHWFARRRLARMGILLAEEVPLHDPELELTGHVDAIYGGKVQDVPRTADGMPDVSYRSPDWVFFLEYLRERVKEAFGPELPVVGVEIKSQHSYAVRRAFKEGPMLHHALQLAGYSILAERQPQSLPAVPERWELLLVGKDALGMLTFGLLRRHVDEAMARLGRLNEAWRTGSWPECTCGRTPGIEWEAKYCKYIGLEGEGCCGQDLLAKLEASLT